MKRSALLLALAVLIPAGEARADFVAGRRLAARRSAPRRTASPPADFDGERPARSRDGERRRRAASRCSCAAPRAASRRRRARPYRRRRARATIAVGDFNGDGLPDLAVARTRGVHVYVLRKADNSGFDAPRDRPRGRGRLDASRPPTSTATAGPTSSFGQRFTRLRVLRRCATPANTGFERAGRSCRRRATRTPSPSATSRATAGSTSSRRTTRRGERRPAGCSSADGTFTPARRRRRSPWAAGPYGMAVADFNGDGRLDVAVGDNTERRGRRAARPGRRRLRAASGAYAAGDGPVGVEAADFNFDGRPDLADRRTRPAERSRCCCGPRPASSPDPSSPIVTNQAATAIAVGRLRRGQPARPRRRRTLASSTLQHPAQPRRRSPPPPPPPPTSTRDNDGVQRPTDCDDSNPAIRPGAVDMPGDGDRPGLRGRRRRVPGPQAHGRLQARLRQRVHGLLRRSGQARAQGRPIRFACKGKGCTRKKAKVKVKKNGASVSLTGTSRTRSSSPGRGSRSGSRARAASAASAASRSARASAQADAALPGAGRDEAGQVLAAEGLTAPRARRAAGWRAAAACRRMRRRCRSAVLIAAGVALALADASVVTLALPPILIELDTTVEGVAAVIGVYTRGARAWRCRSPRGCAGRLGDRRARRAGFAVFARRQRAVRGAGRARRGCSSCAGSRPPARRPRSSPASRCSAAAGSGSPRPSSAPRPGPALGGALTEAFDWRAIFVFGAPVAGLAAAAACSRRVAAPPSRSVARGRALSHGAPTRRASGA